MTNTNAQVKGFYVNVRRADGSTHSTEYHKTETSANAKAARLVKMFARRHPDYTVEVSKTRA